VNIKLMKRIDAVAGTLLAAALPPARGKFTGEPRRILVIRPGGLGDALLLAPALLDLKGRFPQAELTVLAEARNAGAFQLCPAVDRVLFYHDPAQLRQAVAGRFDLVIDSEQWHRLSAVVTRLTRAPLLIGFATNNRRRLFSHQVAYSHDDYEVESFLKLLAPLGIASFPPTAPFLSVPDEAARRAAELLLPLDGRPWVALFPGASIPERRWGAERFRPVAEHLLLRGLQVVVVGGEADRSDGDFIVSRCGGLNLAGKTSLPETAAVIARSLLLLSGDSGVLHLAVGLNVPTVSLFGPGIQAKWGPRGDRHVVLNRGLSCSPCTRFGSTPPCPIGARCLSEIEVGQVVSAVLDLLERLFAEEPASGEGGR